MTIVTHRIKDKNGKIKVAILGENKLKEMYPREFLAILGKRGRSTRERLIKQGKLEKRKSNRD